MKIALVNPNTNANTTRQMVSLVCASLPPGFDIEGVTAPFGVPVIDRPDRLDTARQAVVALAPLLRQMDAVIIGAFGDPGRRELSDLLNRPVTGLAEAAMQEAGETGLRFAVVSTLSALAPTIPERVPEEFRDRFAGVWIAGDGSARTITDNTVEDLAGLLAAAAKHACLEAGAQAIIIGGGPLAQAARFLAMNEESNPLAGLVLIEPISASVRLTLSRLGQCVNSE